MRIKIEASVDNWIVSPDRKDDGNYLHVAANEEAVPIAELFGMKLRHKNKCPDRGTTDGTTDCSACGQQAQMFALQAFRYLDTCVEWNKRRNVEDIFGDC